MANTARRSPAKRPASKSSSPKSSPAKSKSASKKAAPTTVHEHLSPWRRDAAGIALVVLAVLSALALWFDTAGGLGSAVTWLAEGSSGVFSLLWPVALVFWGVLLVSGKAAEKRVPMLIGFALLVVGGLAVASIAMGNPRPSADFAALADAAGFVGAVAGYPLSVAVSPLGAEIAWTGVGVLGALIFTGTSLSRLWDGVQGMFQQIREAAQADGAAQAEEEAEAARVASESAAAAASAGPLAGAAGVRRTINLGDDIGPSSEPPDDEIAAKRSGKPRNKVGIFAAEGDADGLQEVGAEILAAANEVTGYAGAVSDDAVAAKAAPRKPAGAYKLPPMDLLRVAPANAQDGQDEQHTMEALEQCFRTFGVAATVPTAHRGPTVTLYEVEVEAGTKVNKVLSLSDDIAYAMATPDVRIIAPIPGKSAIGVEVPNKHRDFVMLGDILRSKAAKEATHPLSVALGKDVQGRAHMVNLATMPHVLVAGATGAGKSSLVNSFITSLLMRTTPEDVRLLLIDPKRVEMAHYAEVPHLLAPIVVHPKRAAEALKWIVREMELRYEMLATVGVRDIDGYEEGRRAGSLRIPPGQDAKYQHMPFIVVVIDELADLMMVAPRDVEDAICRIAQMARAVGIHLIVATQRPSVDVVTGLIKANIPSRIALMTSSQADSRVVLDMNGAEKLVGHGDMLYAPANASKPTRLQGAWVTEEELHAVAGFVREQRDVIYEQSVEGLGLPPLEGGGPGGRGGEGVAGDDDDLLRQAKELVIVSQLGSTSMLQRKLKVGFARAGRLMDLMEEEGVVGPSQGSKARDVLITPDEWAESPARPA